VSNVQSKAVASAYMLRPLAALALTSRSELKGERGYYYGLIYVDFRLETRDNIHGLLYYV
jgi:hypothetical protein